MIGLLVMCSGGLGVAVTCIARGLWPPRPTLADSLAAYRVSRGLPRITAPPAVNASTSTLGGQERVLVHVAALLSRRMPSLTRQLVREGSSADLAVAGLTPERLVAEKVLTAVVAALTAAAFSTGLVVVADVPLVAPFWVSIVSGTVGFFAPDRALRRRVRERREEMQAVVAVFLYVVDLSLSAGNGIQTALQHAVERGEGWAWRQLRAALDVTRRTRETEWQAIGRLGTELDVAELQELAARTRLAQNDGARIHESLKSFAATLHSRRLNRLEKRFHRNTMKMALASCAIAAGFAGLIGAAAVSGVAVT